MTWCPTCGTRHEGSADCPGDLQATGAERHGRRVSVFSRDHTEVYGILIAQVGERWRARLVTYPSMLWSIPGRRDTMKFVAGSPQEAEQRALEFIREHCKLRGIRILDDNMSEQVDRGPIAREYAPHKHEKSTLEERHVRNFDLRFGATRATKTAKTHDLSRGGLFIITDDPLAPGRELKVLLDVDGYTIPLAGKVAWIRGRAQAGGPPGMGVELRNPPAMYVRLVWGLAKGEP